MMEGNSSLYQLTEELRRVQREALPYCSYINSFKINEELAKIEKGKGTREDHCEVQAKCINCLVALHLRRLNIRAQEDGNTAVLDMNELSRNEEIGKVSIQQLHRESLQLQQAAFKQNIHDRRSGKSEAKAGESSPTGKPRSAFTRKQDSPFDMMRRTRPGSAYRGGVPKVRNKLNKGSASY